MPDRPTQVQGQEVWTGRDAWFYANEMEDHQGYTIVMFVPRAQGQGATAIYAYKDGVIYRVTAPDVFTEIHRDSGLTAIETQERKRLLTGIAEDNMSTYPGWV